MAALTITQRPVAKAVKTGQRFKALVVYADRTYRPPHSSFGEREEAVAYAERWIVANYEGREAAQAESAARREEKLDAMVARIAAGGRW